ncbi:cytochrome b/b6 domain-containing protein [Psychrobium sp. 1_MG-2023]|uniref:cytochrome b/b6 domain-containing protein n=1 Tax=Psychrobium sp. 1_MG-2023 TaxID=3062624 RepID=UPI000C349397|nr:cytochrome b/b6 domain-containing protein [Psychrobium sp. 1_MG-2023]MDP2561084.1 cytochrome b/b6 domain-containing protein [Psychrobium sp. 1_MG-2023]PKF58373.1 cytochrome B [Alteromonadales bacterium alter-6D02]
MSHKQFLIWDLPLRIFHWSFALTVIGCWATHELGSDYIDWHMQLGYIALGLVTFRLIWGFVGPTHARFGQFLPTPSQLIAYIKATKQGTAPITPGHNPLGSLMVLAMLGLVALQAVSGLFVDDEIFSSGPYYNAAGDAVDKLMSTIHHNTFDVIGIAIVFHIAAIVFYKLAKKQNLVKAMVTGKKNDGEVKASDAISGSRIILGLIVAALCCAFIYWLVVINVPVSEDELFY